MRREPNPFVKQRFATDQPASNTECLISVTADSEHEWVLDAIYWSYDGAPASSLVSVQMDGTDYNVDVRAEGTHSIIFREGFRVGKNYALSVLTTTGGVGVTGKLNIVYH